MPSPEVVCPAHISDDLRLLVLVSLSSLALPRCATHHPPLLSSLHTLATVVAQREREPLLDVCCRPTLTYSDRRSGCPAGSPPSQLQTCASRRWMRMVDDSVTRHLASPPAPLELPFCASTCGVGMVVSLYQLSPIGAIWQPPRNQIVEASFLHNNLTAP